MILSYEIMKVRSLLEAEINTSLSASYVRTWNRCLKHGMKSPQEPDYIADLSLKWIGDLALILKKLLAGRFKVGITGVFCHQKPLADYGGPKNPEIGDLLIFLDYREQGQPSKYNSLLLQAKVSPHPSFQVDKNDLHQLALYAGWPKFKYRRAAALNGKGRDIHPKCANSGAKYLLLDPRYIKSIGTHGNFPYGCAYPNISIVLSRDFANEVIEFLAFNAGKEISDRHQITEDWSGMVWDLLEITKGAVAHRSKSGLGGFPRQTHSTVNLEYHAVGDSPAGYFDDIEQGGSGGEVTVGDVQPNDDSGAVSVLHIVIEQSQS